MDNGTIILGLLGIIGTVISLNALLIRWVLNKASQDIKMNADRVIEQMALLAKEVRRLTLAEFELMRMIMMHDAQVRGTNPSVDVQDADGADKARQMYTNIHAGIVRMEKSLQGDK